jgi:hypothetical protein
VSFTIFSHHVWNLGLVHGQGKKDYQVALLHKVACCISCKVAGPSAKIMAFLLSFEKVHKKPNLLKWLNAPIPKWPIILVSECSRGLRSKYCY